MFVLPLNFKVSSGESIISACSIRCRGVSVRAIGGVFKFYADTIYEFGTRRVSHSMMGGIESRAVNAHRLARPNLQIYAMTSLTQQFLAHNMKSPIILKR